MVHPKLILFVDDYDHVAQFLARLVNVTTAFNAVSATDGLQAIELTTERKPDVVLLDVDMAGLDGFATATTLRQLLGESRPLLIGMTEKPHFDRAQMSCLFDFVLMKPIEIDTLLPILRDC